MSDNDGCKKGNNKLNKGRLKDCLKERAVAIEDSFDKRISQLEDIVNGLDEKFRSISNVLWVGVIAIIIFVLGAFYFFGKFLNVLVDLL